MAVEVRDGERTTFTLEEVSVPETQREWRCAKLPSGGGMRVLLTPFTWLGAKRTGMIVSETVVERAIGLAVADALWHPLPQGASGREVRVGAHHLRRAAVTIT
jgi:hypothetical protein